MLLMLAGGLLLMGQAPADAHDARWRPALGETGDARWRPALGETGPG